jgi:hypothetical protein
MGLGPSGMQRQHARLDVVPCDGIGDELLGQFSALMPGDEPVHDIAAEDVKDDMEVEAGPPASAQFRVRTEPM